MDKIVHKTSSHRQEAKEAAEVLAQVKITPRQLDTKTQGIPRAKASRIKPLSTIETVRFRRGCDIANHKNQIIILRKSQYSVKSQSNCGKYEVISTELGWICSCADHRFRNVICKHIFAIFSTLKRKLEAGSQNYEGYLIDFEAVATSKPRDLTKEVNQDQTQLTEEKELNQNTLTQVADYEQELYEKDRYIEELKNKIRGSTGLTHYPREKII